MEKTSLKGLHGNKETWAVIVKVIRKWEMNRKSPPFTTWKISLMLLDEDVL